MKSKTAKKVDNHSKHPRPGLKQADSKVRSQSTARPGVNTNWPYTTPPGKSASIKGC